MIHWKPARWPSGVQDARDSFTPHCTQYAATGWITGVPHRAHVGPNGVPQRGQNRSLGYPIVRHAAHRTNGSSAVCSGDMAGVDREGEVMAVPSAACVRELMPVGRVRDHHAYKVSGGGNGLPARR